MVCLSKAGVVFFFELTAVSDGEEPELGDVAGKDADAVFASESAEFGIKAMAAAPVAMAADESAESMVVEEVGKDREEGEEEAEEKDDDETWPTAGLGKVERGTAGCFSPAPPAAFDALSRSCFSRISALVSLGLGANTLFSKPGGGGLLRPALPDAAGAGAAADAGVPPAGLSEFETV
jgi:hypothetical protein